jgi:hypothetical protein
VSSGANSEEQGWEIFRPARLIADRTPALFRHLGIRMNASNLYIPATGFKFETIIGKIADGRSPRVCSQLRTWRIEGSAGFLRL